MTFSLRWLLGVVALAAVAAFALCGRPRAEVGAAFCFLTLLIPAILAAGIVNGSRYTRTFCIAAIACVPFEVAYLAHSLRLDRGTILFTAKWREVLEYVATNNLRHVIATGWLMMVIMGALSVLCARTFWPKPPA